MGCLSTWLYVHLLINVLTDSSHKVTELKDRRALVCDSELKTVIGYATM
jgi:chromatin remodeling complex protein RSC6